MNETFWEIQGGAFTKLLVSQLQYHLLFALEYQTLYHINGKAQHFSPMEGYANYLIFIFMNINGNIKNKRKVYNKTPPSKYE